jgi:hypothetical protein
LQSAGMSEPANIARMSARDEIAEAMQRSLPQLPGHARTVVASMLRHPSPSRSTLEL